MVLRALHLCSGYGGFELALRLAGVPVRTVAHVERDSHAAATLVARMDDQALDQAPVWSDIETFDGDPWRGRVDLVTAGFPCPDFSAAGQRAGVHGDHWLWPECARVIREVAPRLVFLENVPGLVRLGGLARVLSDLASFGFDAEWGLLSAAAVGASHQRERFWLLAHTAGEQVGSTGQSWASADVADADRHGFGQLGRESGDDGDAWDDTDRSGSSHVGNASSSRRPTISDSVDRSQGAVRSVGGDLADGASETLGDTEDCGRSGWWGSRDEAQLTASACSSEALVDATSIHEREQGEQARPEPRPDPRKNPGGRRWPPLPDDTDGWGDWIGQGGPEPQIRRSTDGRPLGLADALHLGGNGLVPRVAAEAFAELAVRFQLGERVIVGVHADEEREK